MLRSLTRKTFSSGAVRCMSTSPKMTIAQNVLVLENIVKAKTEAELDAAVKNVAQIDENNLPTILEPLKNSYFALDKVTVAEPFVPNPNAWQNKPFWEFAREEAGRAETWPFLVGLA